MPPLPLTLNGIQFADIHPLLSAIATEAFARTVLGSIPAEHFQIEKPKGSPNQLILHWLLAR
jgi:hypothetical protein